MELVRRESAQKIALGKLEADRRRRVREALATWQPYFKQLAQPNAPQQDANRNV